MGVLRLRELLVRKLYRVALGINHLRLALGTRSLPQGGQHDRAGQYSSVASDQAVARVRMPGWVLEPADLGPQKASERGLRVGIKPLTIPAPGS